MPGLVRGGKSLTAIWFHGCASAPYQSIVRVWVSGHQFPFPPCQRGDLVHKPLLKETLSVILEDHSVELGQQLTDFVDIASLGFLGERLWSLAVDSYHLLLARDDSGFDDGLKRTVLLYRIHANAVLGEKT